MTRASSVTISVVLPTYNRSELIREAVESALSQTRAPSEVVVVDDGSEDDTVAGLETYSDRISVLRQANAGVSAARNRGIRESRSEWIAFLDSDDLWNEEHLARLIDILERHPQLQWACSNAQLETKRGDPCEPFNGADTLRRARCGNGVIEDFLAAAAVGVQFITSEFIVRRDLLQTLGGFDEGLRHGEDLDLWWRIARLHPQIGYDPQPSAVIRRVSGDALTKRYWSAGRDICALLERHLGSLGPTPQGPAFRKVARRLLDVCASRAIHSGDVEGLVEMDERFGRMLPARRRLTAKALRFFPSQIHSAVLALSRAPGTLLATLRASPTEASRGDAESESKRRTQG
jgi:glycosyltransferase involved in cell wall biosynthesis